jgi:hypothetical protein
MAVVEPIAVASPLTVVFTVTCKSSKTGQSTPASAKRTLNPPMATGSGGGGAIDLWSLIAIGACLLMRRRGKAGARPELGAPPLR